MKGTWKQRSIGREVIQAALRSSNSLSDAARKLGINRSTLYRWIKVDPSLEAPPSRRPKGGGRVTDSKDSMAQVEWAKRVRDAFPLGDTEQVLVDLAEIALEIARSLESTNSERLAAAGRFQRIVNQLKFEESRPEVHRPKPQRAKRSSRTDPRRVLRGIA